MILVRALCFRHLDRDWAFICVQEMMSERSIQLLSQAQGAGNISIDSSKGSIAPWGLSQAESHAKLKPRFVEFSCSYVEVRWGRPRCNKVLRYTLGLSIRGIGDRYCHSKVILGESKQPRSCSSKSVIQSQLCVRLDWNVSTDVKLFICSRRYENLTLHRILQGFSTSACDWLFPPGEGAQKQSRVSVSDALKRRELLEEFIYWYFDSFVLPLLKVLLLLG